MATIQKTVYPCKISGSNTDLSTVEIAHATEDPRVVTIEIVSGNVQFSAEGAIDSDSPINTSSKQPLPFSSKGKILFWFQADGAYEFDVSVM